MKSMEYLIILKIVYIIIVPNVNKMIQKIYNLKKCQHCIYRIIGFEITIITMRKIVIRALRLKYLEKIYNK